MNIFSVVKMLDLTVMCLLLFVLSGVKVIQHKTLAGFVLTVTDFCYFLSVPFFIKKAEFEILHAFTFLFSVHICLLHSTIVG
jgi:hypothetical protein